MRPSTQAVHAGRPPHEPDQPLNTPITMASTYVAGGDLEYGRYANPTWTAFEDALGALEGGRCLAFSSGLAAVATILDLVGNGQKVVAPRHAYNGSVMQLADLEAQGVPPSSLRWHALARTAWLAISGSIAGLIAGLVLAILVTGALAIDAEGRLPIPPLDVVLPPLQIVAVIGGVLAVVLGSVAVLAARAYGRVTLGERHGGRARRHSPALAPGTDHLDG